MPRSARLRQLVALACFTALEVAREPIIILLTGCCIAATMLSPLLYVHNLGGGAKLARDGGLAYLFMFGIFIAGYAASSALAREIRGGTAASVLAKPVSRELFYIAKYVGVVAVIAVYGFGQTIAILLSMRVAKVFGVVAGEAQDAHTTIITLAFLAGACMLAGLLNFLRRVSFQASAFVLIPLCMVLALLSAACFDHDGHWAPFDPRVDARLVPVAILICFALCVLAAFALALTTRLQAAPAIAITAAVSVLGLLSDHSFGRFAGERVSARVGYMLIPNWQHFWMSDMLIQNNAVPWRYVADAGLYAALYSAAAVCFGALLFQRTDVS